MIYLNGEFVPRERAVIPVTDRGFLFADGVYEVVRIYGGRLFLMERHLERLRNGLEALRIRPDPVAELERVAERLIVENGLEDSDAALYVQVTRGAPAARAHAFPDDDVAPTVYASAAPQPRHAPERYADGVAAILVPDTRWSRCDIKSISLLPNVLANQAAHARGAFEALFVRDGVVLEGSHANLIGVYDGGLVTYPACNYILPGVTRALVLDLARDAGIPAREGPIFQERLFDADELFLSGTTTELMPVTRVDGKPVGNGRPGPVARQLQDAYRALWSEGSRTAGRAG